MAYKFNLIHTDTPIMPWIIAENVIHEFEMYTGVQLEDWQDIVDRLTAKAEQCYQHNEYFRKRLRSPGNRGRDYLYSFMRHWLSGELKGRPEYTLIPELFKMGHEIGG